MPNIELSQGRIQYRDEGSGPVVVLIHGLMANGSVWDRLIPVLSAGTRCIAPDLPLGAHRSAMRAGTDLTPPGLARLIAELLERLELDDVTLVGNDTGGALCQVTVARHPERIGRLVLTNCDAFENFPPRKLRLAIRLLGLPGAVGAVGRLGRLRFVRRVSMAPLTVEPIPDSFPKSWLEPLGDAKVRRDLARVCRGISPEHTLSAAASFRAFEKPVLIAWGRGDRFFPSADAERLAAAFPDARLEWIEDARTFVQMDAPDRLGALVSAFAQARAGVGSG